jgi:hypothetical protein
MAVIFFEGFNRTIAPAHWTASGAIWANGQARFAPTDPVVNKITLTNIGTHANKKLYLGFRVTQYSVQKSVAAVGQPFVVFFNAANQEVLRLTFTTDVAGSADIGIRVRQANATVNTHTVLHSVASVLWFDNAATRAIFASQRQLAFEIDMESATNTLAVQYQGQTSFNSANEEFTSLNAISDIAKIEIYGGQTSEAFIDDLYLVDNTGDVANTWLGVNAVVHSPNFGFSNPSVNQWNLTNNLMTTLNSDDGDETTANTAAFNNLLIGPINDINPANATDVVGGLRIESVARKLLLNSGYRYMVRINSANYEIGAPIIATTNTYFRHPPQFIFTSPNTNAAWNTTTFNQAEMGLKSIDPATV